MATPTFFTKSQWIAIVWTPRFSGLLSIIGSVMVITMILRGGKEKRAKVHNRLLLGLSTTDIINSFALLVSTAPFPRSVGHLIYGAYGSQISCCIQGFFIGVGISTGLYNAVLCVHYLWVIKYNVSHDVLKKYEKYLHGTAIIPTLFLATFAVSTNIIHPTVKANCWISNGCEFADYPASSNNSSDSKSSTCIPRPALLVKFARFLAVTFGMLAFLTIFFCMISIYLSVRKQSQTMKKYQTFSNGNSSTGSARDSTTSDGRSPPTNVAGGRNGAVTSIAAATSIAVANNTTNRKNNNNRINRNQGRRNNKKKAAEETFTQALLYVSAYFFCYIFVIAAQFMDKVVFPLMLLKAIFYPSQGFWNLLIYVRPRFINIRDKKKDESFWWVLKAVITGKYDHKEERNKSSMMLTPRGSENVSGENVSDELDIPAGT